MIANAMVQSFKTRAISIADQAHNPRGALGEGAEFMRGLDESERQRKYQHTVGSAPLTRRVHSIPSGA